MKRFLFLLSLAAITCFAAPSSAAEAPKYRSLRDIRSAIQIEIPPEWDGIWSGTDSTFDCQGNLTDFDETELDTLCGGVDLLEIADSPVVLDCTGSADATTIDVTCTGLQQVFEDCEASYLVVIDGERSGENAVVTFEVQVTISGSGVGCEFLPDQCFRSKSVATRIAPAPQTYCQTPTLPSTWGQIKGHYR